MSVPELDVLRPNMSVEACAVYTSMAATEGRHFCATASGSVSSVDWAWISVFVDAPSVTLPPEGVPVTF